MDELAKAGRLNSSRFMKEQRGQREAEKLMRNGYAAFIEWITQSVCHVPSSLDMNKRYKVDIIRATCECPASSQGGK